MRSWKKCGVVAVVLALGAGACGDDGGGGTSLTDAEKTALADALVGTGELGGFGAFAAYAVDLVGETGKLNPGAAAAAQRAMDRALSLSASAVAATSYDAVGFAIDYDYNFQGTTYSGWFMGVVGWNGIDASAGTVDELVVVGGGSDIGSLPSTASGTIGVDSDVFALYWDGVEAFVGVSGTTAITGSGFSGSQDCSASDQGITVTCEVQIGSMNGNFQFGSENINATNTYTQPPITFSGLPSVRIVMSITG